MAATHPSDARLQQWVEGRRAPLTNNHVQHCPQCLDRLEDLTALEDELRHRITDDLAASDAVVRRMRARIERTLADRETMSVLTDLMNNGVRTSHVLFESDPEDKDEHDG